MSTTARSVTSSGILTVDSVANLMVGQTVQLSGTAFGGLAKSTTYYISAVGASTITLTLTRGGSALVLAGGSGIMLVTPGPRLGPGVGDIISIGSTTITDANYGDFNTIQALVSKVLGPPTNDNPQFGYNQLVTSSPVALGDKVTLSQWVNLRADMIKARGHQTGSASESNNITLPTTSSKITEALRLEFYNYAQTLTTYKDTVGIGAGGTVPQLEAATVSTAVRIDDWNTNLFSTVTLNFGDLATARGYFNAGGQVKISAQLTGPFSTTGTAKSNTWSQMFAGMGTITMDRTRTFIPIGSTGITSNIGYFGLTDTDQQIFKKQAPTGAYTNNEFVILARISAGAVIFTIQYNDLDAGLLDASGASRGVISWTDPLTSQVVYGNVDEIVDGELRQVVAIARPFNYVSIPAPSVSLAGNLANSNSYIFGLTSSVYNLNEGATVEVTLKTQNVPDGTPYQYTVTGVTSDRFSAGYLSGSFTVFNNQATQSWTLDQNLRTDGPSTMTVALQNGQANTIITINDTSRNPVNAQLFGTVGPAQPWVCPPGVRNVTVLIVGGGAGGQSFAGGGGGAGQVKIHTAPTQPGQTYYVTVGPGGGPGSSGSNSEWSGAIAIGGSVGNAGGSSGHGGTHYGGVGGLCTGGGGGGAASGNSGVTMYAAGGGGGGSNGAGGAAPQTYQGGNGGSGSIISWFNNATLYVGGGGGGGATFRGGDAAYGAGQGQSNNTAGGNANNGSGSGGGGGGAYASGAQTTAVLVGMPGGSGGSGFVWIRWS